MSTYILEEHSELEQESIQCHFCFLLYCPWTSAGCAFSYVDCFINSNYYELKKKEQTMWQIIVPLEISDELFYTFVA